MANARHLGLIREGTDRWNRWREENPRVVPDLTGADLSEQTLSRANLAGALMVNAKLRWTYLEHADLSEATLAAADLSHASLCFANLRNADLSRAHFKEARFGSTVLTGATLFGAKDLDTVVHLSRSHLDHLAIRSSLTLPEVLLRACGVSVADQEGYRQQVEEDRPSLYHPLFISYARRDRQLAARIYDSLAEAGIDVWMDRESLGIGERFSQGIFEEIQKRPAFLVLISAASARSRWVDEEVDVALNLLNAAGAGRQVLPISVRPRQPVSDLVWVARIYKGRQVYYLRNRNDPDQFAEMLARITRQLRIR